MLLIERLQFVCAYFGRDVILVSYYYRLGGCREWVFRAIEGGIGEFPPFLPLTQSCGNGAQY